MSTPFELGQRVRMTGTLAKAKGWDGATQRTSWTESALPTNGAYPVAREYPEGVIVGKRTVADGTTSYEEFGGVFTPTKHHEVWLVAFHLRRLPVACTTDQLEATS